MMLIGLVQVLGEEEGRRLAAAKPAARKGVTDQLAVEAAASGVRTRKQ